MTRCSRPGACRIAGWPWVEARISWTFWSGSVGGCAHLGTWCARTRRWSDPGSSTGTRNASSWARWFSAPPCTRSQSCWRLAFVEWWYSGMPGQRRLTCPCPVACSIRNSDVRCTLGGCWRFTKCQWKLRQAYGGKILNINQVYLLICYKKRENLIIFR